MKTLIIFLFAVFNFFSCSFSSMEYKLELEKETLTVSSTPAAVICSEEKYKAKSETEINSMTPRQPLMN